MTSNVKKRPTPDAYDHLWLLLPVFLVFFAMIVFAATATDGPMQADVVVAFEPLPEPSARGQGQSEGPDTSVPSAAAAMQRLPEGVDAEPVATY